MNRNTTIPILVALSLVACGAHASPDPRTTAPESTNPSSKTNESNDDRYCIATVIAPDHRLTRKLDLVIDAAVEEGFAGGVAVMRGEELIYNRVAGKTTIDGSAPVENDTLFHVASISKYFTAVLALRAAEKTD